MLIIPALPVDGIGCTMAEEHSSLLGILSPLKYNPPSTPLILYLLGPSPVIQLAIITLLSLSLDLVLIL